MAEKKARLRAGSHIWSKHGSEFGDRSRTAWDDLLRLLTVQSDWEERPGDGPSARQEVVPPASLGGPEAGAPPARQAASSQALQGERVAMASTSTLPEPGAEPTAGEGLPPGFPIDGRGRLSRPPGMPPMVPPSDMPLIPAGLLGLGTSWCSSSNAGRSSARAMA